MRRRRRRGGGGKNTNKNRNIFVFVFEFGLVVSTCTYSWKAWKTKATHRERKCPRLGLSVGNDFLLVSGAGASSTSNSEAMAAPDNGEDAIMAARPAAAILFVFTKSPIETLIAVTGLSPFPSSEAGEDTTAALSLNRCARA